MKLDRSLSEKAVDALLWDLAQLVVGGGAGREPATVAPAPSRGSRAGSRPRPASV